jgi:ABC-type iron transport system FetAB permease component
MMAGMLLSGARPIYAAIYQFVLLAMIFNFVRADVAGQHTADQSDMRRRIS